MLSQRQARLRRNIWSNLQAILDWAFVLHPSPILPPLRSFANVRSSPPLQCSACQLKLRAAACLSRGPPDQAGTPQSGVAARGSYLDSVSVRRHAKAAPRQGLMLHRLAPMFSVLCGFARSQRTSWTCWMRWRTVQPIPVNYEIGRFPNPRGSAPSPAHGGNFCADTALPLRSGSKTRWPPWLPRWIQGALRVLRVVPLEGALSNPE